MTVLAFTMLTAEVRGGEESAVEHLKKHVNVEVNFVS